MSIVDLQKETTTNPPWRSYDATCNADFEQEVTEVTENDR